MTNKTETVFTRVKPKEKEEFWELAERVDKKPAELLREALFEKMATLKEQLAKDTALQN